MSTNKYEYFMSIGVEYETTEDARLKRIKTILFDVEPDFEGIVFSTFALMAHAHEFTNPPEGGFTQELREEIFERKWVHIRATLSGMINYLNIMNNNMGGGIDMEPYVKMAGQIGDLLVAVAGTNCGIKGERYVELTNQFFHEYIGTERRVKTNYQSNKGGDDQAFKPRNFS